MVPMIRLAPDYALDRDWRTGSSLKRILVSLEDRPVPGEQQMNEGPSHAQG